MKLWKRNLILLALVILIAVIPLVFVKGEYGGSDDKAESVITSIDRNYTPWAHALLEPASGEIESMLFALQAAVGGLVIGFGFGRLSARSRPGNKKDGN
jgi:cobalt/nickel transport protein